ncbi:alpha-ketoglutarate-dependent dioxygenase alkB homolog 7, mitochondrial isoform X1 [Erinaceus europaeus]|uniref:Alpha-ketoglutarate-dependent dioxygenase alkB homolog 7, mitochondrial isoform X1 n=1 Tax=Erinaceus europaeus TaxID=9365 RepID=A0ABM3WLR7_ERIEU|nr:alpha-ketoglutarate-dependent dioxygenase alkB homolog 7, mitochondrial isoform X1 [Erinaceus europaeus]
MAAGGGRLVMRTLPAPGWVRGSDPAVLSRLRDAAVVKPGFLSAAEEETLSRELEPELRRRRYEPSTASARLRRRSGRRRAGPSWSAYGPPPSRRARPCCPRCTSWTWSVGASSSRMWTASRCRIGGAQQELGAGGFAHRHPPTLSPPRPDPQFCGDTIAGLSLLSAGVMRLRHVQQPGQWLELLLEPGSLYVLRGPARYDFSHEILPDGESFFGERRVPRGRRISVICRSQPEGTGPGGGEGAPQPAGPTTPAPPAAK